VDMLFVRNFTAFSGGHLKLADYLRHTQAGGLARPVLYQTPASRAVAGNIFNGLDCLSIEAPAPFASYFLAGEDWAILDRAGVDVGDAPVVNLLQGLAHADPAGPLYRFLGRPALRICVSAAVAEAITPFANGPVHVIENGVEIGEIAYRRPLEAAPRILIGGLKNPPLAAAVAERLAGLAQIELITAPLPRSTYLARLAAASLCVLLPLPTEGFYLPALEAMALGRGVVTTDCGGNRSFCLDGQTCLIAAYEAEALAAAAKRLIADPSLLAQLARAGQQCAAMHTLGRERRAYIDLLAAYLAAHRQPASLAT